jgi:hypothetical protein
VAVGEEFSPLTSAVKRKPFLVLDIESKDGDSDLAGFTRPFMVGVYDGETYTAFFDTVSSKDWETRYWQEGGCVDRAMRFICQKKFEKHQVYAHNAGRFDYLFIVPWLRHIAPKLGFTWNIVPVASSIQVLDIWVNSKKSNKKSKLKWRFLDSYKLIPVGLDKAAKTFGLTGKLKHDLHMSEHDRRWIDYNKQDCVELYLVCEKFHYYIENVLLGEVGMTAPSTSIKLLRRKYLKKSLPRCRETHDFVRSGYFGGRVEPFQALGEKLYYFDINSSYPAAMLEAMPAGAGGEWDGCPPERYKKNWIGFVDVEIEIPEMNLPPLPVMAPKGHPAEGKLIFPCGRLRGVWDWHEIELALSVGAKIHEYHKSVWYQPVLLFKEFVEDLYKYRDKSRADYDPGLDAIVKILLNSAYGKFGMKTLRSKIWAYDDPELPSNAVPATADPDCMVWYAEEEVDAPYIMPQVAAHVTSKGRIRLYKAMQAAESLGGRVFYVDTDSVITNVQLPTSTELGALKDEYPEQGGKLYGAFLGPKLYVMSTDPVADLYHRSVSKTGRPCSGHKFQGSVCSECGVFEVVKAKGFQTRNRRTVEQVSEGGTITMKRLEKIGSLAKADFMRGPRMMEVPRTLRANSGKRISNNDAVGSTRPYILDMW